MMSDKKNINEEKNQQQGYEIRLKGQLDEQWVDWFEGLIITPEEDGNTLLTGAVLDQAALHGLLKKVRDLGMILVSVCPLEQGPATSLPLRGPHGTCRVDPSDGQ